MRILEEDLLSYKHYPVKTCFNAIWYMNFVEAVKNMSEDIGRGINDTGCTFPGDLDPGEEMFDGVMFWLFDEYVVVDYQTFYYDLKLACKAYLGKFTNDTEIIEGYLTKIRETYHLAEPPK